MDRNEPQNEDRGGKVRLRGKERKGRLQFVREGERPRDSGCEGKGRTDV